MLSAVSSLLATQALMSPYRFAIDNRPWSGCAMTFPNRLSIWTSPSDCPVRTVPYRFATCTGPAGSALEIGCGPGTWTPLLADKAGEVTALDLSERMLERAREAVREPNVTFVQGDAASFVTDRAFDRVMSVRVLEYVPEWRSIVRRLEDLVAPGGRAVIVTKTPVSVWRGTGRERWFGPHTMARRLTGRKLDPEFWQKYIPVREMCRAFAEAGLVDVKVRPVIFGLPVYVRGTKQYPIIPRPAEAPALRATSALWRWVSRRGEGIRRVSLVLAESYAVSGRRPAP